MSRPRPGFHHPQNLYPPSHPSHHARVSPPAQPSNQPALYARNSPQAARNPRAYIPPPGIAQLMGPNGRALNLQILSVRTLATEANPAGPRLYKAETPQGVVVVKLFSSDSKSVDAELREREMKIVREVRHQYVVAFTGSGRFAGQPAIVAPYFRNGNMLSYIINNPEVNRQRLILQVAEAVDYLHNQAYIVHGDLKCENVLVSDNGNAKLADFGLSIKVHKSADSGQSRTAIRGKCTVAFAAPELLIGDSAELKMGNSPAVRSKTMKADVYALAMTILQACTGKTPWGHAHNHANITKRVTSGVFHSRPSGAERTGLTDGWWEICKKCWAPDPSERPAIESLWGQLYASSHMGFTVLRETGAVLSLAFLPDSEKIVTGSTNGRGQILNITKGAVGRGPLHTGRVLAIAFSPDGTRAVTSGDDKVVRLWSTQPWDARGSESLDTAVASMEFSMDGNYIALGGLDGSVRMWYVTDYQWAKLSKGAHGYRKASAGHSSSVETIRFVPYTIVVASADEKGTIHFWDAQTARPTAHYRITLSGCCIAFARDGSERVATGALDGGVRICNPRAGYATLDLRGHTKRVLALEFSPSGRHLASASADATVRVWDAQTGALMGGPLGGHGLSVTSLSFSSDGRKLASGSQDESVRVWDMKDL